MRNARGKRPRVCRARRRGTPVSTDSRGEHDAPLQARRTTREPSRRTSAASDDEETRERTTTGDTLAGRPPRRRRSTTRRRGRPRRAHPAGGAATRDALRPPRAASATSTAASTGAPASSAGSSPSAWPRCSPRSSRPPAPRSASPTDHGVRGDADAEELGLGGAIALLVVLMIAYYAGGYVAGRMSRFDGARQGLGTWAIGLIVTVAPGRGRA